MSIQKVLVNGCAGFIGSAMVCRLLRDESTQALNLDKFSYVND